MDDNRYELIPALSAQISDAMVDRLMQQSMHMMDDMLDYKELLMMYGCAIRQVETKFRALNDEYQLRHKRNPISAIESRTKQSVSIMEKLQRLGVPFSVESIEKNLHDVAGVRVICSFLDDIYTISEAFGRQSDVTVLETKDYIQAPKPNGYRSYHMIVSVPIFFSSRMKEMTVEVQLRTKAMDFWASLEHQVKYKHNVENEAAIVARLTACAEVIARTDGEMLAIRQEIDKAADAHVSDEDVLMEKLRKLGMPFD